jgi:tetratricopeptide (TPR) repeat protein
MNVRIDKTAYVHVGLTVALAFFIYVGSVWNKFLYDDYAYIVENEQIQSLSSLPLLFISSFPPGAREQGLYRPILSLTFLLEHQIVGLRPALYHITNLALYLICCALIYLFCLVWTQQKTASFVAALLFAVHPVHAENVNWAVGRAGILSAVFLLCALILYRWAIENEQRRRVLTGGMLAAYMLAVGSYESALVLPLLLVLLDVAYPSLKKTGRTPLRDRIVLFYVPILIATLVYLAIRVAVLGSIGPQGAHRALGVLGLLGRLALVPQIVVKNIWILLFPYRLTVIYDPAIEPSFYPLGGMLSLLALMLIIGAGIYAWRKEKFIGVGVAFLFVTLLPVVNIIPIGTIVAERLLFLPSLGFCMVGGALFKLAFEKGRRGMDSPMGLAAVTVLLVVLALYAIRSYTRSVEWRTGEDFWTAEVKMHPNSSIAHNTLGFSYYEKGRIGLAEIEFRKAIGLDAKHYAARHHLAKVLIQQRKMREAEQVLDEALAQEGDPAGNDYATIGSLYSELGDPIKARTAYEKALKVNASNAMALYELGNFACEEENYEKAVELYSRAIEQNPHGILGGILNNRAIAYDKLNKRDAAIEDLRRALRLAPALSGPYLKLAEIYLRGKEPEKATAILEEALQMVRPADFEIYLLLGKLYVQLGHLEKAFDTVYSYRKITPYEPRMYYFLGDVLMSSGQYGEAAKAYAQALKINPKDATAYIGIGNAMELAGRIDKARELWKQALTLDPQNVVARQKLEQADKASTPSSPPQSQPQDLPPQPE